MWIGKQSFFSVCLLFLYCLTLPLYGQTSVTAPSLATTKPSLNDSESKLKLLEKELKLRQKLESELAMELTTASGKVTSLENELTEAKKRQVLLQEQSERELSGLQQELTKVKESSAALQEQSEKDIAKLEAELTEAKSYQEKLQGRLTELKKYCDSLESQIAELKASYALVSQTVIDVQSRLKEDAEVIKRLTQSKQILEVALWVGIPVSIGLGAAAGWLLHKAFVK